MGLASAVPLVVVFAVVTGFGNGLLLPSLLTWALGSLTFEQRGRGTGVWTSAFFIGQFVCPLVVLALTGAFDSLGAAILSWASWPWPRRSASGWPSDAGGRPRARRPLTRRRRPATTAGPSGPPHLIQEHR